MFTGKQLRLLHRTCWNNLACPLVTHAVSLVLLVVQSNFPDGPLFLFVNKKCARRVREANWNQWNFFPLREYIRWNIIHPHQEHTNCNKLVGNAAIWTSNHLHHRCHVSQWRSTLQPPKLRMQGWSISAWKRCQYMYGDLFGWNLWTSCDLFRPRFIRVHTSPPYGGS